MPDKVPKTHFFWLFGKILINRVGEGFIPDDHVAFSIPNLEVFMQVHGKLLKVKQIVL